MKIRWLVSAFFLLLALGAAYPAWRSGQAGDDGKWLFVVFAAFFLVLGVAPLVPLVRRPPQPETSPTGTRFVPHWFMMLALVVFAVAILLLIIGAFRHH